MTAEIVKGATIKDWTVLSDGFRKNGRLYHQCRCQCGKIKDVARSNLQAKNKCFRCKSCARIPDLLGVQVGQMVVKKLHQVYGGRAIWELQCICSNLVYLSTGEINLGITKSCGCKRGLGHRKGKGVSGFNRLFDKYKRSAKSRGLTFSLTKDEFKYLVTGHCVYCGEGPSNVSCNHQLKTEDSREYSSFLYSGIDRIDPKKGYNLANCTSACSRCNNAKFDMDVDSFYSHIQRINKRIIKESPNTPM